MMFDMRLAGLGARVALLAFATLLPAVASAVAPSISTIEYRIDGGSPVALPLSAPVELPNADGPPDRASEERTGESLPIDSTGLSVGMHLLEVRATDTASASTPWHASWFRVDGPQYLTGAEWFIDSDPGEGLATAIALPDDGVWDDRVESLTVPDIDTSALTPGQHVFYLRVRDQDGLWSKAYPTPFEVADPAAFYIVGAEWVLDPATPFGEGVPMEAEDGAFNQAEEALIWSGTADSLHLPDCEHPKIYVRTQASVGGWSYWQDPGNSPAFIEINRRPRVAGTSPPQGNIDVPPGLTTSFALLDPEDPDCDPLTFQWFLNELPVGDDSPNFEWLPDPTLMGTVNELKCLISDAPYDGELILVWTLHVADTLPPVIQLLGDAVMDVECGADFNDPGATAFDNVDLDLSNQVVITGDTVDTATPGTYQLFYNVSDSAGNEALTQVRTVNVGDTTPPVLELIGDAEITMECGTEYEELGAMATDTCEGDLSEEVLIGGDTVDTATPGTYILTYDVADSAENAATQLTRAVIVSDTSPPLLELIGDAEITVECGEVYEEPGALATDVCEGDLSELVIIAGDTVDPTIPGTYVVTYDVADSAENAATQITRTVFVSDTSPPLLELIGDAEITVECGAEYEELGALATDTCEGDLSELVIIAGDTVDPTTPGTYLVTYDVADSAENAATQITRTIVVSDSTPPVLELIGDTEITVECGAEYEELGAMATDACEGDLSEEIIIGGDTVDTATPGSYEVTYDVADSAENAATQITRTIVVADTTPPVLELIGDTEITVECGAEYEELGALATDTCEGDLSEEVIIGGDTVDTATPGTYVVTYVVADSAENAATQITRTVIVSDTTPPVLQLLGDAEITVECGAEYEELGALATDTCEGDLSEEVIIGGDTVDTATPGTYVVTYVVADSAENAATQITRTIVVADTTPPVLQLHGNAQITLDCAADYEELGASAVDACDGPLEIALEGNVDTHAPGVYEIVYSAEDSLGRSATAVRTVFVEDNCIPEGEGDEEGMSEAEDALPEEHSADQNGDYIISLSELLRVIQFFNTAGLHCANPPGSTEDGFVPGPNPLAEDCAPHASDYNPQDWVISLSELLRLIQFFNTGGYFPCPELNTEDGYCVGTP